MHSEGLLTRREMAELALRATALPGAALFFSAFLKAQAHHHGDSEAPPDPKLLEGYQPKFFNAYDFAALQEFTEILIPTDDAPGAKEAYCAEFIDFVLQASSEMPEQQTAWRSAMAALKAAGFHAADAAVRLQLVTEIDAAPKHPAFAAYRLIKQQTAFAFYTSRKGMIETLDYKGNSYNITFPACNHPEHQTV